MRGVFFLVVLVIIPARIQASPVFNPGNGHFYELVTAQMSWAAARDAANAATYAGFSGHLVTVTSAEENAFISSTFASGQATYFAWLGGYEPNDDGVWLWGAGPENGVQFSAGAVSTPPYNYANWEGIEPNDYAPGEDFLAINLGATFANICPGGWADSPNPTPSDPITSYIIEYETTHTGVGDMQETKLLRFVAPNPFQRSTRIAYSHRGGQIQIDIFDVTGRRVRTLLRGNESGGDGSVEWDGRNDEGLRLNSGAYVYVVRSGSARAAGKLLLIQ